MTCTSINQLYTPGTRYIDIMENTLGNTWTVSHTTEQTTE